jgi:hypothetical protein
LPFIYLLFKILIEFKTKNVAEKNTAKTKQAKINELLVIER